MQNWHEISTTMSVSSLLGSSMNIKEDSKKEKGGRKRKEKKTWQYSLNYRIRSIKRQDFMNNTPHGCCILSITIFPDKLYESGGKTRETLQE